MGKKIMVMLCSMCIVLYLTACGGDAVQGSWKLESGYVGDTEVTQEQLQSAGIGGTVFTFQDGTVTIETDASSEVSEGTYTLKDSKITISADGEEEAFVGTVEDDKMTIDIEEEDMKLIFQKQ